MRPYATPESIGEANKKIILDRLRTQGDMSRADLSRATGMSFTAVASNVRHLLERDYVHEAGAGGNAHGRKSTLLSFNARRGFVVGVDIGRTKIRCLLADLRGGEIASAAVTIRHGLGEDGILAAVCGTVDGTLKHGGMAAGKILSLCVGIPGIEREGRLYLAPNFAELSIDRLRDVLAERYQAPVLAENGVNLGAMGVHRYGVGSRYRDMVYISYGVGLGGAVILGGALHSGFANAAGEIGFMQVRPDSARVRFSQTGDAEQAVSPGARPAARGGRASREFAGIIGRHSRGDAAATAELEDIASAFAGILVNVSAVVNPMAVILSGGVGMRMGGLFLERWREHLARYLPFPPELRLSELDGRETMLGAVGAALDYAGNLPVTGVLRNEYL